MSGLTPALAGTTAFTNTNANNQVISCNPSTGDTLIIVAVGRDASAPAVPTITDSFSGGLSAWSNVGTGINGAFASNCRLHVQYATCSAGATNNVTCTWQATIATLGIVAIKIPGTNTANPFGAQAAINATGTSTSPAAGTMSSLTSLANQKILIVASIQTSGASFTPESGWTELADAGVSEGLSLGIAYLTTTAADDNTPTGTLAGSAAWKASAFEVSALAGIGPITAQYYSQMRG